MIAVALPMAELEDGASEGYLRTTLASPTDITLFRRAQTGDGVAFAALYDRHAPAALRLASRLLHNSAAAEDVVQEAFLTLWRTAQYDAAQGSVRTYLMAIVHNRGIDRLRRDRRYSGYAMIDETVANHLAGQDRTDEEVERSAVGGVIRSAITALPDEQRATLELAYFGGLTHMEIAALRHEPIGTVKGRLRLGLHKLRDDPGVVACR